jgi:hypothetical protein
MLHYKWTCWHRRYLIGQFWLWFFFFLHGAPAHIGPWPPLYEVP